MRRRPEDLDPPRGEVDDKHRVERDQATPRPHFRREEIRAGDRAPVRAQKRLPRCRTLRHGRDAVRPQNPGNRRAADAMPEILERALDPRVAPRRILLRHPHRPIGGSRRGRRDGVVPVLAYVHLRAMSCRCHRSIVSGVTIVATSRKACRPSRYARAASRRRSSSVSRRRRPPSCRRRTRFSSIRYASASRSRRSSQPVTVEEQHPEGRDVDHGGSLHHSRDTLAFRIRSAETWDTSGPVPSLRASEGSVASTISKGGGCGGAGRARTTVNAPTTQAEGGLVTCRRYYLRR